MLVDGKPNPIATMLVGILSTLAEFELEQGKERKLEGIANAKKKGVYVGRSTGTTEATDVFLNKAKSKEIQKYLKAGESIRRTAKLAETSVSLVQKVKALTNQ